MDPCCQNVFCYCTKLFSLDQDSSLIDEDFQNSAFSRAIDTIFDLTYLIHFGKSCWYGKNLYIVFFFSFFDMNIAGTLSLTLLVKELVVSCFPLQTCKKILNLTKFDKIQTRKIMSLCFIKGSVQEEKNMHMIKTICIVRSEEHSLNSSHSS